MQTIITGKTHKEAEEKFAELSRYIDPVGGLTLMSGWTGTDLSVYGLDEPITNMSPTHPIHCRHDQQRHC